jgi:hypothetical protein
MPGSEHGLLTGNRQRRLTRTELTVGLQESQVQGSCGFWLQSYPFDREERDRPSPPAVISLAVSFTRSFLYMGVATPCPLCHKGNNGSYGKVVCPVDESPRMYQPVEKVPAEPIDGPESGSERPERGISAPEREPKRPRRGFQRAGCDSRQFVNKDNPPLSSRRKPFLDAPSFAGWHHTGGKCQPARQRRER